MKMKVSGDLMIEPARRATRTRRAWSAIHKVSKSKNVAALPVAFTFALSVYNFVLALPHFDYELAVTDIDASWNGKKGIDDTYRVELELTILNSGTVPVIITQAAIKADSVCDQSDNPDEAWWHFVGPDNKTEPVGAIVVKPNDAAKVRAQFYPEPLAQPRLGHEIPICLWVSYIDRNKKNVITSMRAGSFYADADHPDQVAIKSNVNLVTLRSLDSSWRSMLPW
jgi:hypothetical protein